MVVLPGIYYLRRFGLVLRGCLPTRVAEREPVRNAERGGFGAALRKDKSKKLGLH